MRNFQSDFNITPGQIWLNNASEGPLPKVSAAALAEAVQWKSSPERLSILKFQQTPLLLKKSIAQFCALPEEGIVLGNSATYGLHLLANGLNFKAGDEIILMCNDFPTDILPWLYLEQKGVIIHQLKGRGPVLTVDEIKAAINAHTRLICLPLVHTFSGWKLDIDAIAALAKDKGIYLVINMSQAYGAMVFDLPRGVDALVCAGYKWLLGPYGTGFAWFNQRILNDLDYPQGYWISLMDENSLSSTGPLVLNQVKTSRRYDVFGTANFFNFVPWTASLDYLNGIGIQVIEEHSRQLVSLFCASLDLKKFLMISPIEPKTMTNIVVFSHQDKNQNAKIFELLKTQGIHLALWKGLLRVSPHVFNDSGQINTLVKVLNHYVS